MLSCAHTCCERCISSFEQSDGFIQEGECPLCEHDVQLDLNPDLPDLQMDPRRPNTAWEKDVNSFGAHFAAYSEGTPDEEAEFDSCIDVSSDSSAEGSSEHFSIEESMTEEPEVEESSQFCHLHPDQEQLWICTSCDVSICSSCRHVDHSGSNHNVEELVQLQSSMFDEVEFLQEEAQLKMSSIERYIGLLDEHKMKAEDNLADRTRDINQAYKESLQQLTIRRGELIRLCEQHTSRVRKILHALREDQCRQLSDISSASEVLGNRVEAYGSGHSGHSLIPYRLLCRELQDIMSRDDPADRMLGKVVTTEAAKHSVRDDSI